MTVNEKDPQAARSDDVTGVLRRNKLFSGMSFSSVAAAIANTRIKNFPTNCEILAEGAVREATSHDMYLILTGSVQISRMVVDAPEEVLATLGPGEIFGEMAFFSDEPRSARAVAIEQSMIGVLGRAVFERLCIDEPLKVLENLTSTLASRLRQTNEALIATRVRQEKLAVIGSVVQQIAHDLKSPLNVVAGVAELIEMGKQQPSSARMLRRASQAVSGLVEDILAFAADRPRRPPVSFAVADLLESVEDFGLAPIEQRGRITVRRAFNYAGEMVGDRVSIERALLNLIKNANEAMIGGGILTVSTSLVGNQIEFAVSDTGPGMPPEVRTQLFRAFVTSGKAGGTGLGLPMVKRTVDAHGGTVEVDSASTGTKFVLRIPQRN